MARISGVNIPTNKKINVALTYIFGIGKKVAVDICSEASVDVFAFLQTTQLILVAVVYERTPTLASYGLSTSRTLSSIKFWVIDIN